MCFVEPVADILKNESVRAIIEQRETTFEQEFADALNNLGVARDLYQLVLHCHYPNNASFIIMCLCYYTR